MHTRNQITVKMCVYMRCTGLIAIGQHRVFHLCVHVFEFYRFLFSCGHQFIHSFTLCHNVLFIRGKSVKLYAFFMCTQLLQGSVFENRWTRDVRVTFDAFVPLVPASKLLAFRGGDVNVVGTVQYRWDHALTEKGTERNGQEYNYLDKSKHVAATTICDTYHSIIDDCSLDGTHNTVFVTLTLTIQSLRVRTGKACVKF